MKNIKEMSDRINLKFSRVLNAEDKTKALGEFTKDYLTQVTANRRLKELEKELEAVLKDTLKGTGEVGLLHGCCGEAGGHLSVCICR